MEKREAYKWVAKRVRAQVERHVDPVATLANTAAILKEYFPAFFWVGFYFVREEYLLLGPFQGPPACVKLARDKGVCAASAAREQTILVPDVHEFPGHVACDTRSRSEIVVPVYDKVGALRAVLDVDSESLAAFDEQDAAGLEQIAALLQAVWPVA
ncbi:MAG TPA: GAF domain-containing protein [bacterium]|nr:GAF domain-containing protein [bacterium]HQG47252.1 GAF domain-containing protein [bacterium]HQI48411.1 GAF domain-containing protein [bacterium]HQJ63229.1 GAF domain-containing protein [bacterium]